MARVKDFLLKQFCSRFCLVWNNSRNKSYDEKWEGSWLVRLPFPFLMIDCLDKEEPAAGIYDSSDYSFLGYSQFLAGPKNYED